MGRRRRAESKQRGTRARGGRKEKKKKTPLVGRCMVPPDLTKTYVQVGVGRPCGPLRRTV